jgi:glycosyltransferase involved in cell wall biosynthesis
MPEQSIEVTIPVLDEESGLEQGIMAIYDFMRSQFPQENQWSIVIADNGSNDQTPEISKKLAKQYSWLKYIRLNQKGVGLALKTSWQQSKADIVGYFDLDLATNLTHLPETFHAIAKEGYDVVYGTSLHKDSIVKGRSLKREITSRVFSFIIKNYLGTKFSDGMCGFKFLRRGYVDKLIAGGAVSDGWFFSTELLVVSEWMGLEIYELPIHWTDSSDSKVKILSLVLQYLKAMKILKKKEKTFG